MAAYRKHREEGKGEKVIYSPSAYPREDIKKKKEEKINQMHPIVALPGLLVVLLVIIGVMYAKWKGHY